MEIDKFCSSEACIVIMNNIFFQVEETPAENKEEAKSE